MKKTLIAISITGIALAGLANNAAGLHISDLGINKGEDLLTLNFKVDPRGYKLKGNEIVTLTPVLTTDSSTLRLPSVGIAGKNAWYARQREGNLPPYSFVRASKGDPVNYSATIELPDEFCNSCLIIRTDTSSICNCRPAKEGVVPVAGLDFRPVRPTAAYHYIAPSDSVEKIFNLSGKANIIFKVNSTEIDWSYAGNYAELDTILRTINAVRDNPDATVESITLTGYASPEGSYANNVRLAKGRTEAVKDYVVKNSSFPVSIYRTSSVAEDWGGLKEWLEKNNIPQKREMIAFINDRTIPDDTRNDLFRNRFPEEYPFLLKNVYPLLRHTDYHITYRIRRYYDVEEIRRVAMTNPRNLSLNELFILANNSEKGSPEYDEAFELAARLYPESKVANLNAANSAINRGRYDEALRYLERAGDGGEVDYAKGMLLLMQENYEEAIPYVRRAAAAGVAEAPAALEEIDAILNHPGKIILY